MEGPSITHFGKQRDQRSETSVCIPIPFAHHTFGARMRETNITQYPSAVEPHYAEAGKNNVNVQ